MNLVLTFEYVTNYQVGDKVAIPVAEELLANYNDFYAANTEFYQGSIKKNALDDNGNGETEPEELAPEDQARAEKRVNDDVKAFSQMWGSMDFASATLVGLNIDWDKIQDRLLVEQAQKVRPEDSALIPVAQTLRRVASVLAFSERIVTRLRGKAVDEAMIQLMVQGFNALLQQVHDKQIEIPELHGAENKRISKLKTVDGIIDYANSLFALGR